mmetsp:Transcript_40372/g.101014  ORF Transcript_40372/g.101014 Transcript_40372/m.101014 type:complete len:671 (-) Transcript_40372:598-2610(-)
MLTALLPSCLLLLGTAASAHAAHSHTALCGGRPACPLSEAHAAVGSAVSNALKPIAVDSLFDNQAVLNTTDERVTDAIFCQLKATDVAVGETAPKTIELIGPRIVFEGPNATLWRIGTAITLENGLVSISLSSNTDIEGEDTFEVNIDASAAASNRSSPGIDAMCDVLVAAMDTEHPRLAVSQDGSHVRVSPLRRKASSTIGGPHKPRTDEPGMLSLLQAYQHAVSEPDKELLAVAKRELQRRNDRLVGEGFLANDKLIKDAGKLLKEPITEAPTEEKVPNLVVPTVVPGQDGVFPRFDELIDAVPSTNLGDALRAIGIPITERYVNSTVGQVQNAIGDLVNSIERFVTAYITPENLDRLELEPLVSAIEQAALGLSPLYQVNATDPIYTFARGVTENVWSASQLVDRPEAQRVVDDLVQDRLADAIACAIIGNSNSEKCPVDSILPASPLLVPTTPTPGGVINSFGFPQCIEVSGYQPLCEPINFAGGLACIAGRSLEPQNFDGVYTFDILDRFGFPIYGKGARLTGEVVDFPFSQATRELFLSRTPGEVGTNTFLPQVGTFGTITPNEPNFNEVGLGTRPPFATTAAGEGESIAPIGCDAIDPFGGEGFPQCLSGGTWILGRAGSGTCTGVVIQGGASCIFGLPSPQIEEITITPVDCPFLPPPFPRP